MKGAVMVGLIEIVVHILQAIGTSLIRSRSDIDRIERQIERRAQAQRGR